MAAAPDPFTWDTLGTIGGAILACTIVPNVLAKIVNMSGQVRAGIATVLALVIEVGLVFTHEGDQGWQVVVVAVLNGFLVAAATLGVNTASTSQQLGITASTSPSALLIRWL
jgi:hypothetical protein